MTDDDRLGAYMRDSAEHWKASHERMDGLGLALMVVTTTLADNNPEMKEALIRGLEMVGDLQRRDQAHPALLAELDRLRATLREVR